MVPQADLYAFNLQDVIPAFPLPLRTGDSEPLVDLQSLLTGIYDRASYDLVIWQICRSSCKPRSCVFRVRRAAKSYYRLYYSNECYSQICGRQRYIC
ncbi:DUF4058 family protein [Nostoc sp.]|uniref:DUF4058 family protein n=1 Tax=Nostoc sp. TaxID=1180 RepID=UPI003593E0D2